MSGSPDREILTIEEAAELLGVSVKTFNKVLHSEAIPARKIGREWKFSRSALIEWVGSGRSDQFYREARGRNGYSEPQQSSTLQPEKPRGAERRRTTGWKIELD